MNTESQKENVTSLAAKQVMDQLLEINLIQTEEDFTGFDIEKWTTQFIKNCLGFSAFEGFSLNTPRINVLGPTLTIEQEKKPIISVEILGLGSPLNQSILDAEKIDFMEFFREIGETRWGLLTNGFEWKLFDFHHDCTEVTYMNLKIVTEKDQPSNYELGKASSKILNFTSPSYESGRWKILSRNARRISSDNLVKALFSPEVIEPLVEKIKQEHTYGGTSKTLMDRFFTLFKTGLENSSSGLTKEHFKQLDRYVESRKLMDQKLEAPFLVDKSYKKKEKEEKVSLVDSLIATIQSEEKSKETKIKTTINKVSRA